MKLQAFSTASTGVLKAAAVTVELEMLCVALNTCTFSPVTGFATVCMLRPKERTAHVYG